MHKKIDYSPTASSVFDTKEKRHWQDPPVENIDNCKTKIHQENEDNTRKLRVNRQGVLRNIYSQKQVNRENLNEKLTSRIKRKDLETRVLEMKKTLRLMEKKYHLTHIDAANKQNAIQTKEQVTIFKKNLDQQKTSWIKKKQRVELIQRNEGIMEKEETIKKKIEKMQSILDEKKLLVKIKKAQYETNCDRRQQERIEDLQRKAESANRIRKIKKEAKINRIEFFNQKYKHIKDRITNDIQSEENRIIKTNKLAEDLLNYGAEINYELKELEKYHQKVDKQFYNAGDILCKNQNPASIIGMSLDWNKQLKSKLTGKVNTEQIKSNYKTKNTIDHGSNDQIVETQIRICSSIAPPEEDFAYLPDMDEEDYKDYLNSEEDK